MSGSRLLIDSHILVWLLYEPERFDAAALEQFRTAEVVYVSAVSLWELAIKHANGKLGYSPEELAEGREALGLKLLPLEPSHMVALRTVDLPHTDPFDWMLLAQATVAGCTFVTADMLVLGSGTGVPLRTVKV